MEPQHLTTWSDVAMEIARQSATILAAIAAIIAAWKSHQAEKLTRQDIQVTQKAVEKIEEVRQAVNGGIAEPRP